MPKLVLPLNNLKASVERPVIKSVVDQVKRITRIHPSTPVRYYGDENAPQQKGSALGANSTGTEGVGQNIWHADEKLEITVTEAVDQGRLLGTPVQRTENLPVFVDRPLDLVVKPVYVSMDVEIEVKYRAPDENSVKRWYNDILTRCAMQRDMHLVNASYHYEFPKEMLLIIDEIHKLREAQGGYGQDALAWFQGNLTDRARVVADFSGNNKILVIQETQGAIQGRFDFQGVPQKPERDGEKSSWLARFVYRFSYEKPVSMAMRYPAMVHNQLLSTKYRSIDVVRAPLNTPTNRNYSGLGTHPLETNVQRIRHQGSDGLTIPSWDEFKPNVVLKSTVMVMSMLVAVNPENRKLGNLGELGVHTFHEKILEFLRAEAPWLGTFYKSIFTVDLYANNRLQAKDSIKVDAELNMTTTEALDIRRMYQIRVGLVVDLGMLPKEALDRVRQLPGAATLIAIAIDGALRDKGNTHGKNKLRPEDYAVLGLDPKGTYKPWDRHDTNTTWPATGLDLHLFKMRTVEVLFIATRPMHLYPDKDPYYRASGNDSIGLANPRE